MCTVYIYSKRGVANLLQDIYSSSLTVTQGKVFLKSHPQSAESNSVVAPSSPSGAVAQAAVGDKGDETHPL